MAVITISRDPFARVELVRQTIESCDRSDCAWCGQNAKFEYGYQDDNYRTSWLRGQFCSVGCMRSYHE